MELVTLQAVKALKAFFISLPAEERTNVSQLAQTVFLKDPAQWIPQTDNVNNGQEEGLTVTGEQQAEGSKGKILLVPQTLHKALLGTLYSLPSRLLSVVKLPSQESKNNSSCSKYRIKSGSCTFRELGEASQAY